MIRDIRVHAQPNEWVEAFATLAGRDLFTRTFFDTDETRLTFFLAGQYLALQGNHLEFSGNGGWLSEYMFGSPMPIRDRVRREVRNRLILFGSQHNEEGGLQFTPNLSGKLNLTSIFEEGHSVANTFFLVSLPGPYSQRRRQQEILRLVGRILKRSPLVGREDDAALARQILQELAHPEASLLLLRLVLPAHAQFLHYLKEQAPRPIHAHEDAIHRVADALSTNRFHEERIKVDILYNLPENRSIVDEYKDILVRALDRPLAPGELARLNSLRNLAMRHDLPPSLFDTLDDLLTTSGRLQEKDQEEPSYLTRPREVFESLFLSSRPVSERVTDEDIVELLFCKQKAAEQRDNRFEQIMLDVGRMLDETLVDDSSAMEAFEVFSKIITYFDRYDNTENLVAPLAFMEHARLAPEKVRSLLTSKREFELLKPGLFKSLIFDPNIKNLYSLAFGREKLVMLIRELEKLEMGEANWNEVSKSIDAICAKEKLRYEVYDNLKERLSKFYFDLHNDRHLRLLRLEIQGQLRKDFVIPKATKLSPDLFNTVVMDIQKETYYLNSIYPKVLAGESEEESLREDFLANSGLDRFHVEELEALYRQSHGLEKESEAAASF